MRRSALLAVICALASLGELLAQEIPNINPKVKIIGGSPFYVHEVLEGQQLDAIAAAYRTSPAKIEASNPGLSEPIPPGELLRIPYSDASATVMTKFDLKPDALKKGTSQSNVAESRKGATELGNSQKSEIGDLPEQAQKVTDVPLVDDKAPHESVDSGPEVLREQSNELAELSALSASINQSIDELAVLKQEVETKAILDADGLPKVEYSAGLQEPKEIPVRNEPLNAFLERYVKKELDRTFSNSDHLLREYFLVRINEEGIITNVRDERTQTNENTHFLNSDSLKGYYLTDDLSQIRGQFIPIGLVANFDRTVYRVKFRKNRAKFLSGNPDAETMNLVLQYGGEEGLRRKHKVTVLDLHYYIATYQKFEYNPFGKIDQKLFQKSSLLIEQSEVD